MYHLYWRDKGSCLHAPLLTLVIAFTPLILLKLDPSTQTFISFRLKLVIILVVPWATSSFSHSKQSFWNPLYSLFADLPTPPIRIKLSPTTECFIANTDAWEAKFMIHWSTFKTKRMFNFTEMIFFIHWCSLVTCAWQPLSFWSVIAIWIWIKKICTWIHICCYLSHMFQMGWDGIYCGYWCRHRSKDC